MDLEEKKYYVAFSVFEGIGPQRFNLLRNYFGSAKEAYLVDSKQLMAIGLGEKLTEKFLAFRRHFDPDSYLLRLNRLGIEAIGDEEENYPKLLKEIPDRPFIIYIECRVGPMCPPDQKCIAVVGTRKMTAYGRQVTEKLTKELVQHNFVIVSGLAYGVDRIAHETAINNKGMTIAVFGTDLNTVYPPQHTALARDIIESGGALVSEIPLGGRINPGTFAARNRIISGLSLGVVVTEAAEKSGSLITASNAAEQGREVFAVPGPINSPMSAGTALLIKKGAKLVYNVQDILEEIVRI